MMLPNTIAARKAIDTEKAAMQVFRSTCRMHEIAMRQAPPQEIEVARLAVLAAEEAYLDAKQLVWRLAREFAASR